jgi:hypothetical protein
MEGLVKKLRGSEYGLCNSCGDIGKLNRHYFYYEDIKCECHSPQHHFEIIWVCDKCPVQEPLITKIEIKTENLKQLKK